MEPDELPRHEPRARSVRGIAAARRWWDLLAPVFLGGALLVVLLHVGLLSPGDVVFPVDRIPSNVILHNVLELERDAVGPFRWTRPRALFGVPVGGPASYRVTLELADSPDAPPKRPVTVTINGKVVGSVALDPARRTSTFSYDFGPGAWAATPQGAIYILLEAPPFVPLGETRVLGPIVSRVGVEPIFTVRPLRRPNWLLLAAPNLLLALTAYCALRSFGANPVWGMGALALGLVGYALLARLAREDALSLAYQPAAQPARFALLWAGIAAAPLVARASPFPDS